MKPGLPWDPKRCKAVSRPLPAPAVSPAGAFPGWPDSRAGQLARRGPERAGTDSGRRSLRPGSAGHNAGSVGALDPWATDRRGATPDVRRESRGVAARGGRGAVEAAPAGAVLTRVSPEFAPVEAARSEEAGGGADLPQPPRHVRRPPLARISPRLDARGCRAPAGRLLLLRSDHQDHAGRVRAHVVRRPPQRDVQDSALAVASDDDEISLDLGGDLDD